MLYFCNKDKRRRVSIMPKPELTKKLLADTLKNLISQKPLDKISVGEIADAAGLNRQTFYYHFADKQALVCWIFDTEVLMLTDKNHNDTILDDLTEYIYSEKEFYIAALTSDVQNNLREHIYDIGYNWIANRIIALLGENEMEENAIGLLSHFFTNAAVGTLVRWAQEGMKIDYTQYNEEYAPVMVDCLKFIVEKYSERQ